MADHFISREDAEEKIERLRDKCGNDEMEFALNWALERIKEIQTADVRPVVRGQWVIMSGTVSRRQCTACGWDVPEYGKFYSFCPNCGADMREVQDGLQSG